MSKAFWAVVAIIVVVFGGIILFHNNKAAAPTNSNGAAATNHTEGKGSSGVTLVEYGDYECPFCGEFYPTVKQVVAKYNDQIIFQFRNLPLLQIHPNALAGAKAAEAAGLQGKFWEMHDLLYANQSDWAQSSNPQSFFNQYATQLSLNLTQFKQDYASDKVNNSINADIAAFQKTGQSESTPSFFLDGKYVQPSNNSVQALSSLIDAEIAKKTKQ
ncbi:MAG TPA: thioredoxin domain-containing protein [Candidatus Saccharimonadales bacterium]|nr:thioredoxin domain-containing protein [Candidatus Saccharimonadales bacterium]